MSKVKKSSIDQLIPVNFQKIEHDNTQTVNARNVHEFLEVKTVFVNWIQRNIKRYDFIEGVDYVCFPNLESKIEEKIGSGGHNIKEYYVSLDMAKELSMVQNNPKGKEARQYFIQCEKIAKAAILKEVQQLRREANREWKQLRNDGKMDRRTATDAEKRFVDYAVSRGSSLPPKRWFSLLAEAKYDAIIIPGGHMEIRRRKKGSVGKNGVDVLTSEELRKNSMMDLITGRIIDEALVNDEDHHKIFKSITGNFKQYGNMFNAMFLPSPRKSLIAENQP